MRVLFINKFIPPDPAPTAVLIDAVARTARDAGWEVAFAGSSATYRDRRPTGWRRWLHEGSWNLRILCQGLTCPRPDLIVCLTDPPGSLVAAAVVASLRRAKLAHWAMDVYPEIAVALGELRAESAVHRAVRCVTQWARQKCDAIACLDDDMVDAMGLRGDSRAFISTPWPPAGLAVPQSIPAPDRSTVRWLYSGNLGRAHDFATLLRAQRRLEDADAPFELVFQGGGAQRDAAMRMAGELRLERCRWHDYAPEETLLASLLEAHVLVATQKPETRGLLWPSKLAPMLRLPRAIAWIGPTEGAVAQCIRQSGGLHGSFTPGDDEGLANWLMESRDRLLSQHAAAADAPAALHARLAQAREKSLETWRLCFDRLVPDSGK